MPMQGPEAELAESESAPAPPRRPWRAARAFNSDADSRSGRLLPMAPKGRGAAAAKETEDEHEDEDEEDASAAAASRARAERGMLRLGTDHWLAYFCSATESNGQWRLAVRGSGCRLSTDLRTRVEIY